MRLTTNLTTNVTTNVTTLGFTPPETPTPSDLELGGILLHLRSQRRFRIEQLRELVASTAEALANSDEARLQVTQLLTHAAEAALDDIEGALRRLEAGTYGTCAGCHQAIAWRRLQMLPRVGLCTTCHYLSEHGGLGKTVPAHPTTATGSYVGLS